MTFSWCYFKVHSSHSSKKRICYFQSSLITFSRRVRGPVDLLSHRRKETTAWVHPESLLVRGCCCLRILTMWSTVLQKHQICWTSCVELYIFKHHSFSWKWQQEINSLTSLQSKQTASCLSVWTVVVSATSHWFGRYPGKKCEWISFDKYPGIKTRRKHFGRSWRNVFIHNANLQFIYTYHK